MQCHFYKKNTLSFCFLRGLFNAFTKNWFLISQIMTVKLHAVQ
jgi:hypothetical protein